MKLKSIFEDMDSVLNELNEQFEAIKKHEARIPQIEIDILMSSIRKLYENMSYINKKTQQSISEKPETINIAENKSIVYSKKETELIPEEEAKAIVIAKETEVREMITNNIEEETISVEKELKDEQIKSEQDQLKTSAQKNIAPKEGLLLKFEDELFSVNDSVAMKSEDKSVVNKLSNTRIENLKSAIGINDKFFFINELFKGNSQSYEDVIFTLNNFKRFEEAMQYTSTLKYRYDWDTEAEAYLKLIHFLERKFLKVQA